MNVCPKKGCVGCKEDKAIPGLGYNNCYNDKALTYINGFRKQVGSPALEINTDYATKAQDQAVILDTRGSTANSDTQRPTTCNSITFHQVAPEKIN